MKNKTPRCQYTIVQDGMGTLSGLLQKVPRRFTGARWSCSPRLHINPCKIPECTIRVQLANHKNLVYCMEHYAIFGENAEKRGPVPGPEGKAFPI